MGFEIEPLPYSPDRGFAQPAAVRHRGPRPVGGVLRQFLQGRHHHVLDLVEQDRRRPTGALLVQQTVPPGGDEPGTPPVHRGHADPEPRCDLLVRVPSAQANTIRARIAKNCAVLDRRVHRVSSARSASLSTRSAFGRPTRGSSSSPANRRAANRDRHARTVATLTENRCATAAFDNPSADASTMPARSADRPDPPSTARSKARRSVADSTISTARGPGCDITTAY